MEQAVAYSTLALTVALAVSRPRVGRSGFRITPGIAAVIGVVVLLAGGLLRFEDLWEAAHVQWRPLLTLTCIMVMTGVVKEVGAFERMALRMEAYARTVSAKRAFTLLFIVSVLTPSLLNNDAAILLLTPVVVALAHRLYPGNTRILEAFAFTVFLAPGVAPFIISNPMNLIVAEFAGVGFNAYAAIMVPIAIAGALCTYLMLRLHYRDAFAVGTALPAVVNVPQPHRAERPALIFLLVVFFSYPVMAAFDGPIWSVAVLGAIGTVVIARHYRVMPLRRIKGHVSVDILAFLWGVFLVVAGLRAVGVVDHLANFYRAYEGHHGMHVGVIGVVAAVGSAIVDNHPMALLNMMALGDHSGSRPLLAALIGGDIGPRLLPIGSLAGLLWMDLLRRRGIEIDVRTFVRIGTLTLIPTLAISLLMLWLL